jgi:flagellar basal-body rod protein FlgB
VFGSISFDARSSALDALSLRQRAIADNIATVQTPGYQAKRVQFEDALTAAVSKGSGAVSARTLTSLEPTREDGNNVNLDTEVLSNIDTNLRYQLATRAMDGKFAAIRSAIRSS